MKPTAWFDQSNGVVSTDRDSPLFTPLGQVWPLFPKGEWVGLTYEEETELIRLAHNHAGIRFYIQAAEAKLKELNK